MRGVIDITISDLEAILHWYHVYKNEINCTKGDQTAATKIEALLLSRQDDEGCCHPQRLRDLPTGEGGY